MMCAHANITNGFHRIYTVIILLLEQQPLPPIVSTFSNKTLAQTSRTSGATHHPDKISVTPAMRMDCAHFSWCTQVSIIKKSGAVVGLNQQVCSGQCFEANYNNSAYENQQGLSKFREYCFKVPVIHWPAGTTSKSHERLQTRELNWKTHWAKVVRPGDERGSSGGCDKSSRVSKGTGYRLAETEDKMKKQDNDVKRPRHKLMADG